MNRIQKIMSSFLAAATLATSMGTGVFAESRHTSADDVIHEGFCVSDGGPSEYGYIDFKNVDENGNEVEFNLIPAEGDRALQATLPSKYSMVDLGYLPSVRNQGSEGSCWAHAGMAMAESSMIKQGLASASTVDFSEKHLAWFAIGASAPAGDPMYGDFSGLGAQTAYDGGGNMVDVMFTLMAWIGVEQEANVPYQDFSSGVSESYRYHSYGHLQNVNMYDSSDTTSIKQAIMNDGAVQIAYYADGSYLTPASSNSANFAAYYCPDSLGTNHSITVVGWDDNFSRYNFKAGSTPSKNGAWLCRNSWGSYWGTNGYFYMSYEDATVRQFSSLTMESTSNYGKVYQYDGGCEHSSDGYIYSYNYITASGLKGAANVFTASDNDEITAVSYYTPAAGFKYEIKVYTDLTGNTPDTGKLASSATVSGTAAYAGYHTVKLPAGVSVKKGSKFAVSVDLSDSSGTHYVITDKNDHAKNLSFYYFNSKWNDCYDDSYSTANIRLKAYTKATTTKPQNVKVTPGDAQATVTWDKVDGATNYIVYTYTAAEGYKNRGTTTGTSKVVTGLTNGTRYAFLVKAYVNGAYSTFTTADFVYATPVASNKPTNVKVTAGDSQATVTWNKVNGATNYIVYTYTAAEGYKNRGTTTGTSKVVTGLTNGTRYAFLVKAYVNGAYNAFTAADFVYATPVASNKPTNVKVTAGDSQATVTWNKVNGATNYIVYTYTAAEGYKNRGTTTGTSKVVTGLTNGTRYAFLVKAYVNGAYNAFTAADFVYATPVAAANKPTNVKVTAGDSQATVTWNKVNGATNYIVYTYTAAEGYKNRGTTTGTSKVVTGLTNGTRYAFLVKAYVNGAYNAFTAADFVYATPVAAANKPTNVKVTAGNGKATVTWDKVSGATNYIIYTYTAADGYKNRGTTTGTSLSVTGLTNGTRYAFLVKAYVNGAYNAFTAADFVYATPSAALGMADEDIEDENVDVVDEDNVDDTDDEIIDEIIDDPTDETDEEITDETDEVVSDDADETAEATEESTDL